MFVKILTLILRKVIWGISRTAQYPNNYCDLGYIQFISATDYGLDGPGSNAGGDEIFRPSRPALVSTQPPVKLVPGLSQG